jgi:hypothetical protein
MPRTKGAKNANPTKGRMKYSQRPEQYKIDQKKYRNTYNRIRAIENRELALQEFSSKSNSSVVKKSYNVYDENGAINIKIPYEDKIRCLFGICNYNFA